MEIKKIEKNIVDYPKAYEVSKKVIKKSLPNKFFKFAMLITFVQNFSNRVKVFATELAGDVQVIDPVPIVTAGVVEYVPDPMYIISSKVGMVSAGILSLSLIGMGVTKIIHKAKKIEKPIPKVIKVIAIGSGVLTLIGVVGIVIFK